MSMNESVRPRLAALKSTMTGNEYADRIAAYVLRNFGARGLMVYREVSLGKTIIGKNRHVDIFVVHPQTGQAFAVECKYQDSTGTVDEKIPYAIQDMQAMGMPVCLAYAGAGFSEGILHMLAGCPIAAYCMPPDNLEPCKETRELDVALAMTFHWWDLVLANKKPFVVPAKAELPKVEPAKIESAKVEPAKIGSAKVEPAKIEPAKVEPAKVEPARVEPE